MILIVMLILMLENFKEIKVQSYKVTASPFFIRHYNIWVSQTQVKLKELLKEVKKVIEALAFR